MQFRGRKIAVTGAGRGLGAALAIKLADEGARPVLIARNSGPMTNTAWEIRERVGIEADRIMCDLASTASATAAGRALAKQHPDLDGLLHVGAKWSEGALATLSDGEIHECVASAASGALILTRHALPALRAQKHADLHVVVSTSGLPGASLAGTSIAFRAAKAAQDALVAGLAEELEGSSVRVTASYPDDFDDLSPLHASWGVAPADNAPLDTRDVVEAILFALSRRPGATLRSVVIQ